MRAKREGGQCFGERFELNANTLAVVEEIQMPEMDGYEATRAIRAMREPAHANIPILAMTANAFKEDEEAAFEAGMQAHIAKPIDVNVMMKALARVLK